MSSGKITIVARTVPDRDALVAAEPRPTVQVSVMLWSGGNPVPVTWTASPYVATSGETDSRGAGTSATTGTVTPIGGSPSSSVVTVSFPVSRPAADGVKVTVTAHRPPLDNRTPRQPVTWNGPLTVTAVTVPGPGPVSVTVMPP
jgi:hypothetical protein